jgi:hypothetical protein
MNRESTESIHFFKFLHGLSAAKRFMLALFTSLEMGRSRIVAVFSIAS